MRRGPLYMVSAAAAFTAMVGFVKVARQELPAAEILVWRGLIGAPLVWLWARRRGLTVQRKPLLIARVLLGFSAMFCYYTAAKGLSVADLALLTKLQPMLIALIAPLVLGASERSPASVWLALLAGLLGSAILLTPKLDVGLEFGLWALGATVLSGSAHLCVRALGRTEDPVTVVFWFQAALTLLAILTLVITTGALPSLPESRWWPYLVGCALTATAGQLLMTRAYQIDPAPVVAAAAYTGPFWAVLIDLVVFAALPSAHAMAGGVLIVGAGLWLVLSQKQSTPQSAAPTLGPSAPG